ncbi:MAG: hypothetical protein PHZ02_02725 [Desulfocapsaceae bacterium]|nr:hypothetical protein [Desulfocapsaceae bacterium]
MVPVMVIHELEHAVPLARALVAGGVRVPEAITGAGLFPQVPFCPTGGISAANYRDYPALKNVACVGGSWIVTADLIAARNWDTITELAVQSVAAAAKKG